MTRIPGTHALSVMIVERALTCLRCGETFLHVEVFADGDDACGYPDGCPECGGELVALDG